jgi:Uncharacterized protein conserved in bacteria (DUF2272)
MKNAVGTWRLMCLVAVVGSMLAACAVQPVVRRPPVDPALVKGNILRLANAEWNAFGGQTISYHDGRERIDPVGVWEDERRGSPRIGQYWRIVGEEWSGYDCDKPWSAAFISWLMLEAGVPADLFEPSGLHSDYLRAIAENETDPAARFALRDAKLYSPRPGDLICATRAGASLPAYNHIPDGTTMHCDLVVFNEGGRLESIGGNVRNSVSKTVRQIGADGLLPKFGDRPWVLVVEDRYPDPVSLVRR